MKALADRFSAADLTLLGDDVRLFSRVVHWPDDAELVVRPMYAPGAGRARVDAAVAGFQRRVRSAPVRVDYRVSPGMARSPRWAGRRPCGSGCGRGSRGWWRRASACAGPAARWSGEFMDRHAARRMGRFSQFSVATACQPSLELGLAGPVHGGVGACAAGVQAVIDGLRMVQRGEAGVVLAGGTDSALSPLLLGSLANAGAIAPAGADLLSACRPFDRSRSGMVAAEGAAVFVLEPLERAVARRATVRAVVAGGGSAGDAHHAAAPHPQGRGAALAMAGPWPTPAWSRRRSTPWWPMPRPLRSATWPRRGRCGPSSASVRGWR